ncbi:solute carrier family 22 member 4-like [Uranotaenia lowii]|uniref:solute carrier family 22 member 4-like n=1 Tax=Uranotaenia lowii TaxID=190385 RepID=UPI00247AB08A|nr:solute carrier family 22 member 4-like [Uranotaenia lowii]
MAESGQDTDVAFDRIMEMVGDAGPFQRRYNLIFNTIGVVFYSMNMVNVMLVLAVPEHHCLVPGKELYSIIDSERWYNLTLPKTIDSRGEVAYDSCTMYNVSRYPPRTNPARMVFGKKDIIPCQRGYWYDRQYYGEIPVTQKNWVCEKEVYGVNIFSITRVAEGVGTFVLGQMGDRIGRLPIYISSILLTTFSRAFSVLTLDIYWLYAVLVGLGSFVINTALSSSLIVLLEISRGESRGTISLCQLLGYTIGNCLAPMILWWSRDWVWFLLITSVPCVVFVLIPWYCIESPRWLATQGQYKRCLHYLKKIAKVNKKDFQLTEADLRDELPAQKVAKTYGFVSLFSGWHMTKISCLFIISTICNSIPYFCLFLISLQMDGNPFFNVFWQSLIEFPAYFCGQVLCDRIGRRFSTSVAYLGLALTCIPVVFIIQLHNVELAVLALTVIIKSFVCIAYFALYLLSQEMYPVFLRQTGTAFFVVISKIFGVVSPYVVYLGTNYDTRLPFIVMGLIGLIGFVSSSCLPETLHQKLPETMQECRRFGKNQRFWSLPRRPRKDGERQQDAKGSYETVSQQETLAQSEKEERSSAHD